VPERFTDYQHALDRFTSERAVRLNIIDHAITDREAQGRTTRPGSSGLPGPPGALRTVVLIMAVGSTLSPSGVIVPQLRDEPIAADAAGGSQRPVRCARTGCGGGRATDARNR
jgi:hypothetical protein